MSKESAENIVNQLQQAHRISVAFYQRILPTFDMIASQVGCNSFLNWAPIITSRIGRSTSQPSKSWAWDYVPLYASSHSYRYARREKSTGPEDFGIMFDLYIEDSFSDDKGQPDPIKLPSGKAILQVGLYRPKKEVKKPFDVLWKEEADEDLEIGKWTDASENWRGILFEWPLADIIIDHQCVIKELQQHIKLADK